MIRVTFWQQSTNGIKTLKIEEKLTNKTVQFFNEKSSFQSEVSESYETFKFENTLIFHSEANKVGII